MTHPDIITGATNIVVHNTVDEYVQAVPASPIAEGIHAFADIYIYPKLSFRATSTWAEVLRRRGQRELLLLILRGADDEGERVFIEPTATDGGPAAIVVPGFYYPNGEEVADLNDEDAMRGSEYGRPVVRRLTEIEGLCLVEDLQTIMSVASAS